MNLSDLLGPVALADITAAIQERRLLHQPCGQGERLSSRFSWERFVSILNLQSTDMTGIRVFKDGRRVPLDWLTGRPAEVSIDGDAFKALAQQGISVVLNRIEHRAKEVHDLWREAREIFACPLQMAYFANFGPGYALNAHFDRDDIVIIQIAGRKEWEIIGEVVDVAPNRKPTRVDDDAVTRRFVMTPGDVLVLPYGLAHRCHTPEASLQLGMLVERPHGWDYFKRLVELAGSRPEFRRPAPVDRRDKAAVDRYDEELRQAVVALMDSYGPRQFLAEALRGSGNRTITLADLPPTVDLNADD
ncbi:JmjC domain-containing protein [Endothiovibrio diazotrophicus]